MGNLFGCRATLAMAAIAAAIGACGEAGGQIGDKAATSDSPAALLDCGALTAPVYHRVKPSTGDSLFTTSAAEAANSATNYGYTEDHGIAFRASTVMAADLTPAYRLVNPATWDHLWTISATEKASAASEYGYTVDEGTGFYVSATAVTCTVPVYRYVNKTLGKHRFAASDTDRESLVAAGWTEEGVKFYAAPAATTPVDTRFTLAVIPDTQQEIVYAPTRFTQRMQWIADHQASSDIRFVLQVGDMVDWDTADHVHYARAATGLSILDDAHIPYATALGNHDTAAVCEGGSACSGNTNTNLRNTATYNTYFPTTRFAAIAGVYEPGKIDNSYHTFSAGGVSWLVLTLELWARTGAITWAKDVLAAHPQHNVIVITHSHLNGSSAIEQTNGGYGNNSPQYVFDNLLKQYPNVRLVFSGHVGDSGYRVDKGVNGNPIHQFLNCYHDNTKNPTRLVEIDTAAGTLDTWVYHPLTDTRRADGAVSLTGISWVR